MDIQNDTTRVTGLKQHLILGLLAWGLLGGLTATLDAQGAGIISLFGGIGAWLATGAGLALAYMAAFAAYRHRGRAAAAVVGGLSMALAGALLVAIDWNAVMQAMLTFAGVGVMIALVYNAPSGTLSDSVGEENDDKDGWRCGPAGPGYYIGGIRQDD